MGKNYFSEEHVNELKLNPYVKNVSNKAITYTDELKNIFMNKYNEGMLPSTILRELGFNTNILGKRRIDGIVERMHKHVERGGDCHDLRSSCSGRPSTKELTDAERIARLEHQISYLKQENEFFKKTEFLDRQAEWKVKQKQRQKKSLDSSKK